MKRKRKSNDDTTEHFEAFNRSRARTASQSEDSGTNPKRSQQGHGDQAPSTNSSEFSRIAEIGSLEADRDASDDSDRVEELIFSSEEEFEDDTDLDPFEDVSVISISSSDSEPGLPNRPWLDFDIPTRNRWEEMYERIASAPLHGSWEMREEYQRELDAEMLRYLNDFPLKNWVIGHHRAGMAFTHLQERLQWRSLGIPIHGHTTGALRQAVHTAHYGIHTAQQPQHYRPVGVPGGPMHTYLPIVPSLPSQPLSRYPDIHTGPVPHLPRGPILPSQPLSRYPDVSMGPVPEYEARKLADYARLGISAMPPSRTQPQ